jgi:zinc/manganese transport system permease protein
MAGAYILLGVFHVVLRKRFLTISFEPQRAIAEGWSIRWWDFWFYLSFGVVITLSVPIAGVLLVFSFLVVPAAVAFQVTTNHTRMAIWSWVTGVLASAVGLALSFTFDLPTGPVIVCVFGAALALAFALRPRAATRP